MDSRKYRCDGTAGEHITGGFIWQPASDQAGQLGVAAIAGWRRRSSRVTGCLEVRQCGGRRGVLIVEVDIGSQPADQTL